ncbi:hypothetical protein CDAR_529321 [Caerostris darwini]|uniref:Uncharacterized protein n=1 Tax=Caerostris darwini TaxID=1538125 RepID=A0AAV4TUY5_9ARAC|nr:hypothetical protein CDAR_529321 [Caerostris darwini]
MFSKQQGNRSQLQQRAANEFTFPSAASEIQQGEVFSNFQRKVNVRYARCATGGKSAKDKNMETRRGLIE